MTLPTIFFSAISLIGVCGLALGALSLQPAPPVFDGAGEVIAKQKELIAALNKKADALDREARAATNLAEERERTIEIYRRLHAPTGDLPRGLGTDDTFGLPATAFGGGNGR